MKKNPVKIIITVIGFLLSVSASERVRAIENEVWISPIGPANTNFYTVSGTPSDPFRCPDTTSLNTVLQSVLTNNNLTIHLMGGVFQVPTNGIVPRVGWKLRGAGIDNTTLQMHSAGFTGLLGMNGTMVVGGYGVGSTGWPIDGVEVSDLTVDCNFQNQTNLSRLGAVALSGNNSHISGVKAINWGSATAGYECFVLYITVPNYGYATNCVIEQCVVTQPAPVIFGAGASAINLIGEDGSIPAIGRMRDGITQNNLVYNVQVGTNSGMPNAFNAYGTTGIVRHNQASDIVGGGNGIYRDTWNGGEIVLEDNVIDNVTYCIYFNMTAYHVTGLVIKNNILRPAEGGVGLVYYTGPLDTWNTNAFVKNFVINNNVIYPSSAATNTGALSLNGHISATVMNNTLQGAGNGTDFFVNYPDDPQQGPYPHPLQLNTWSGNVNMAGTQLVEGSSTYWQPGDQDTIKFTPTPNSNGWYRIMAATNHMAAAIKLESELWNNATTDTEFWFRVNSYATTNFGELGLSRRGSYSYPSSSQMPSARIVSDWPNSTTLWLDIYLPTVTSDIKEVRITAKGYFRSRLLASPQLVVPVPNLYQQLNF